MLPDTLVSSPLLAVMPSPERTEQETRARLEAMASRQVRAQHALPDEFQGMMVTRWSARAD